MCLERRWVVLIASAVAFMAAQGFGRFGITLILPAMRDGLGLTNAEMGVLTGLGLAAYLVSSAPAGAATARFGIRWVTMIGLVATALGLALNGVATDFATVLIGQLVLGAAAPVVIVPLLSVSSQWFDSGTRARATGVVVAGGGLGILLAGLWVPHLLGDGDSWRRAWLALSVAVGAVAVVSTIAVRSPPRQLVATRVGLGDVYRSPRVWFIGLLFGLYGVSFIVYGTFFGAHLDALGVEPSVAGRLWALGGLVAVASGTVGGILADRFGPATALVVLFTAQATSLVLLATGDSVAAFGASIAVYGLSMYGFPSAITKACAEEVGAQRAAAAIGLAGMVFGLGQCLGPAVGGLLSDALPARGLVPSLLFAATAATLGSLSSPRLRHPSR